MSSELAVVTTNDKLAYAQQLADSGLLPAAYRKNPANVLWAIEYGAALGISPVVAVGLIHVMDGKPVASATMIGGLVRRAGHRLRIESNETRAVARISRSDDREFWFEAEFSMADAKRAGIDRNPTWGKYPRNMMEARATTACARKACPEVLMGIEFTAEELGGNASPADLPPGAEIIDVGRWSDLDRKIFCAKVGELGFDYDDVAAWCESIDRPRPSAMSPAQREKCLDAIQPGGKLRAELEAWVKPAAPNPAPEAGQAEVP